MSDRETFDLIARLPCWRGRIEIEPLAGGMTNRNYKISDSVAGRFVVRVGSDLPDHGVMRFNELAAARAGYAAGISPEVVYAMPGMLVCRYIDSRTLTPEEVRDPRQAAAIIALMRRCHYELPRHFRGPVLAFWVFQVVRNYLAALSGARAGVLAPELSRLAALGEMLERQVGPIDLVFGHNDWLAANVLDDGERLWLIDWDYAGLNSPLFDLANLSSNNGFDETRDAALLAGYFGAVPTAATMRAFAAMKCASLLRETLWGGYSELHSAIDFDYAHYTRDYLQRLDQAALAFSARHR